MKRLSILALACTAGLTLSLASTAASACADARWQVKVGADLDAPKIAQTPVDSSVEALARLPAPADAPPREDSRYAPAELTVYRVHATITRITRGKDNGLHIVIADGKGRTMIAESPDPSCATGSRFEAQIWMARDAIDRHIGRDIKDKQNLHVPVTLTGVGFFNKPHSQPGAAKNGIELHPLLEVSFD
ncbi:MAG TPA: hypothetical protein VKC56_01300 [Gallionellaceae bacterium]|nr:hypothetical protein [Gallionellaceae bacterium]